MNAILVFYSYKKPWDQTAPKRLSWYASDLRIFFISSDIHSTDVFDR